MLDHLRLSRFFSLTAMALALSACGDLSDFDSARLASVAQVVATAANVDVSAVQGQSDCLLGCGMIVGGTPNHPTLIDDGFLPAAIILHYTSLIPHQIKGWMLR